MSPLILIVIFSAATITLFLYGMGVAFGRRRAILAGVGFILGMYGSSFGFKGLQYVGTGAIFAAVGYLIPSVVVRIHQQRRRAKFVRQLADALMLLTNSLRSGYGFLKGLELI